MAWDDEPPSKAELQQAPSEQPAPAAEQEASSSWTDQAPPSPSLTKLMQQGYLFDDYQKLDPEEKAFYDEHMKTEGAKHNAGLGLGLSKGAFMPVEIANKVIPGERPENIRQSAISGLERGIANTFGDDQTKELYANISPEELKARNVAQDEAVQKAAPGSTMAGELIAGLPANIAVGGGAGAAAKAAQLGKLATAATNIGTAGVIGEGYGIAHSNAPTLAERATDALPSAAIAAGTAGLLEGGGAIASQEGQAALKGMAQNLRGKAANAAESSLNPTAAQRIKLEAPGKQNIVGETLLDEGMGSNPLMSDEAKASALMKARNQAASGIDESTASLDREVANVMDDQQGNISQSSARKQLAELENQPKASVEETEALLPDTKTASAEAMPEDTSLGFPRNEVQLSEKNAQSKFIPVEKVNSGAGPEVDAQIQKLADLIKQQPNKADQVEQILNKDTFIRELEQSLSGPLKESGDPNGVQQLYSQYLAKLNDIGGEGTSLMSLNGLNKFKQELRQGVSYQGENSAITAQAKKDFTRQMNDMILGRAQKVDQIAGTDLSSALIKSNQEYGALKTGTTAAQMNAARGANKSDIGATVLGTAKKFVKNNYNSFAATGLNQLSKLVKTTPQVLGKYAPALQDAANRGTTALSATHFALYQNDPSYRQMIDPLKESGEQQAKEQNQVDEGQVAMDLNK